MTPHGDTPGPNIVLICVDQWRGDCLSADGHPVVRTPYLDALAARGVRFRNAYSATPTCVPARMALLTGLGLVWVNLAVGIVGSEGNPANLLFMPIPLLALIGAAIARLRPRGMAWAMAVTGALQLLLAGVAPFSLIFALPWFASAWLFRKAARV